MLPSDGFPWLIYNGSSPRWSFCVLLLTILANLPNEVMSSASLGETSFSYFDDVRAGLGNWTSPVTVPGSGIVQLQSTEGGSGEATIRLADITTFLPFSEAGVARSTVRNDAATALLAARHFNERSTAVAQSDYWNALASSSSSSSSNSVPSCNLYLTLDIWDTKFSPIAATRAFTQDVLQRPNTLQEPLPAAVVGAYRSATTSPLAILTGVNDIPQVSYSATSTDFDVKEQYPRFGRTIGNSQQEANAALQLFQSWNATHVGVLFVTDAYGSALQKSFQDAATAAGVVVDSIAFAYTASDSEIYSAISSLKATQYRFIYAICFETHLQPLMEAAVSLNVVGEGYAWIFPGVDSASLHAMSAFPTMSAVAKASNGVGILQFAGGLTPDPWLYGVERIPALVSNPTSGYERFRAAWRESLQDPKWVAYVQSKYPATLVEEGTIGWDPLEPLLPEPPSTASFVYDAVFSLGMAMCMSGNSTHSHITGSEIYETFLSTNYEGASGLVTIDNSTGTREHHPYVLNNVLAHDTFVSEDGTEMTSFAIYPSKIFEEGKDWTTVRDFEFADGTTTPPLSLPRVQHDRNYVGNAERAIGYTLMSIVMVSCIATWVWLAVNAEERVVRSSQPIFLIMVSLGSFIMALTIYPMGMEETTLATENALDMACQAVPWVYMSGAIIAFAALFAKTRAMYQAYSNAELEFILVTGRDVFVMFLFLFTMNVSILLSWTIVAPLEWDRHVRSTTDTFGRPVESYGICTNEDALPFVILLITANLLTLVTANFWSYKTRNIETEYHESRFIAIAMASVLQAWCMGIPILIMVWDNPQAKFFVCIGIVFVTCAALLGLIFVPKIVAVSQDRRLAAAEEKRAAFRKFAERKTDQEQRQERWSAYSNVNPSEQLQTEGALSTVAGVAEMRLAEDDESSDFDQSESSISLPALQSSFSDPDRRHVSRGPIDISSRASTLSANDDLSARDKGVSRFHHSGIKVLHNPRSQRLSIVSDSKGRLDKSMRSTDGRGRIDRSMRSNDGGNITANTDPADASTKGT